MSIVIPVGTYVIAVSGGVDSVALLHMASHIPGVHLTVAHYDHGIRPNSHEDRRHVQQLAAKYGVPFVYAEGNLGKLTSEAIARQMRYAFLRQVSRAAGARAIITAHHQDDVIETAIINLLRGTGRRGLSSLKSQGDILRPLLHMPKSYIRRYAEKNSLAWREDSTNQDEAYLRNYVRLRLVPKFGAKKREALLKIIGDIAEINQELDTHLINYLHVQPGTDVLDRRMFIHLPHAIAREVLAGWLRNQGLAGYDRRTLERLVVAAKTGAAGSTADIGRGAKLRIGKDKLALLGSER